MTQTSTLLTQLGRDHEGFGSVNPPIYRASTILFDDFDSFNDAYHGRASLGYGRQGNPTIHALADALSQLIDADHTVLTASGLLACTIPLLAFLTHGDHILMIDSAYGPTRHFCDHVLKRMGIETTYYEPECDAAAITTLMQPNTKVLFMESPGSMTFEMQDIAALCAAAKAHGCMTMLDYTWATPLYIKPFDLGVDIAIQAVTKYVSGHSDMIMGAISCNDIHKKQVASTAMQLGNYVTGDECALALRGLRTMQVRLEQQTANACELIRWLEQQPEVREILYPAMEGKAGHAAWNANLSGACSLFGIVMKHGFTTDEMRTLTDALHHFGRGFSWGGYESLIIPFQPAPVRTATSKWATDDWCIRIHVGLEAPHDLIADMTQAFSMIR